MTHQNLESKIRVLTSDSIEMRGGGIQDLDVKQLAVNVNVFLDQMTTVLQTTPEKLDGFHFAEFEVHAEISGEGQLILLGTGGKVGATGGIKFVFRRSP